MKGLLLAAAIGMSFVSVASAAVAPSRKPRTVETELPRVQPSKVKAVVQEQAPPPEADPEFTVTDQTEAFLDGKPWAYQDVPARAGILRMEVAPDRKTVLKVFFRTRR